MYLASIAAQSPSLPRTPQDSIKAQEDNNDEPRSASPSERAAGNRTNRQQSSTASTTTQPLFANKAPIVQDQDEADPDDSLGAPPAYTSPSPFDSMHGGNNPFMANPFLSPQHHQALTRMMSEDGTGHSASASSSSMAQQQSSGFAGGAPPGFTVITPQEDLTAKWWKLLHFVLSVLLGLGVVYQEYRRSGHLERFDALATEKPLPYATFQVAATVSSTN